MPGHHHAGSRARSVRQAPGASTLEVLFALALAVVASATSMAAAGEWRGRVRAQAAARLVLAQVRTARAHAVREGTHVAVVFREERRGAWSLQLYRDGNGDGVRRVDIDGGVDVRAGERVSIGEALPGTSLGIPLPVPPIEDGSAPAPGSSPVRLAGGTQILSCGPSGGTTSGTIYVAGPGRRMFAVRMLGATGRLRLFELVPAPARWVERW